MISLEASKVTENHAWELSLEGDFWIISIRFLNQGHIENSLWHIPWLHHASFHGIIINISFLHLSIIIFMHHIFALHHHAYAFNILFILQTAYLLFSCSLMHDPCIFLCKTKKVTIKHKQCIIQIHPCFSLVALLIAFFPWKPNFNHCYQKGRTHFTTPLPNAC